MLTNQYLDASRLCMLLHSGVLSTLQPVHAATLVPWLYAIGTSKSYRKPDYMLTNIRIASDSVNHPYTELAYHGLLHLARVVPKSQCGLSASLLAFTLVHLGAKADACPELSQVSSKPVSDTDDEQRGRALYRVVSIITAFARYIVRSIYARRV